MIPNLWQLQYDPFPLTSAATAWSGVADQVSATADRVIEAVRRVVGDAWESSAAESFDAQHRLIVSGLDGMAEVARQIAGTLGVIAGELEATQQRLDQDWVKVKLIPHEFVGAEKVLLFWPAEDSDTDKVNQGLIAARSIRGELDSKLYDRASELSTARSTFESSRGSLVAAVASSGSGADVTIVPDITYGSAQEDVFGQAESGATFTAPGVNALGMPGAVSFQAPSMSMPATSAMAGGIIPTSVFSKAVAQSRQAASGSMPMGGGMPMRAGGGSAGARPGQSKRRSGVPVLRASEEAAAQARQKAAASKATKVSRGPVEVDGEQQATTARTKVKVKVDTSVWLGADEDEDKVAKAHEEAERAEREEAEREAAEKEAEKDSKRAEIEERRAARAERRAARLAEAAARGA